ncbi:MAG: precorrin-6y C5,15-methyltransferase (decarboxylating) subunit CbiE [Dehalococcoidia bacterium]|nr:Cobalamin biosynthesis bifunctional protein CbiET [Chloroflexota bacterium]MBT9159139.1 Cobalamin biosynthesis bifunctional protein CbiET [Chloroflexota bacterium]
MSRDKVYIVGVSGSGALEPEMRRLINQAELIFGGERLLDMFPLISGQKVAIRHNLAEVTEVIKANVRRKRMVVLASGDPNFYGIAKYLTSKLGKDIFEIIPNVSSMQLAFAKIKESWDDATFTSVHSRPIEDIVETVRSSHKVGIFTDEEHTPAAIARVLLAHGVDGYQAYVCQELGGEDERVIETDLHGLCQVKCSSLNILVLLRAQRKAEDEFCYRLLGIPDEEFRQRRPKGGLITKLEVRAVSLAKMCLAVDSVVWDIGAGSGAVSIEASFLARNGRIFAIEKNTEDVAIIRKNLQRFGASNVEVIQTLAPDGLGDLPDPTAVFIGGSGGRMEGILDIACRRLKLEGRIVINAVTLENLNAAVDGLKTRGFTAEVTLINIAHSKDIANLTRLEALNPVFVIVGWKGVEDGR